MDISRRPHDKFFRAYFSDPGILADLIRFVLPAEVIAALDLSTLRIDGGTYIDRALREHFSDIAASVALAPAQPDAEGRSAQVYILVEHKSYHDPSALLQILRYMVQIWSERRKASPGEPLNPIIPVLVYHGERRALSGTLSSLFSAHDPPALRRYRPEFRAEVLNLTTVADERLPERPLPLSAGLWALKYARGELARTFAALDRLSRVSESAAQQLVRHHGFAILQLYLFAAADLEPHEVIELATELLSSSLLKEEVVSTAEKLLRQGREKGREEGHREGAQARAREDARRMLAEGLDEALVARVTELPIEVVRELAEPKR